MTTAENLRQHLDCRQSFWDRATILSLEERKLQEIEFHNLDRGDTEFARAKQSELHMHENRKWYTVTKPSRDYVQQWIERNANGMVFLDYACGLGENAMRAARAGAKLSVGIDISDESIRLARGAAEAAGWSGSTSFVQADCERTDLPDASFDRIICSGMLHHLDLDLAYAELRRILRPGGRVLCVEALGHNPLIQAYRSRTPQMRTEWESQHILRTADALRAKKWFNLREIRYWHLCDLASVPLRSTVAGRFSLRIGRLADSVLLRIPGIRRLAWQFTFELEHPP